MSWVNRAALAVMVWNVNTRNAPLDPLTTRTTQATGLQKDPVHFKQGSHLSEVRLSAVLAVARVNAGFHGHQVQIFFSTTKPYLAAAKETGSVYLALCPCLQLQGVLSCLTLTACRTQGGMKQEICLRPATFCCSKKCIESASHSSV